MVQFSTPSTTRSTMIPGSSPNGPHRPSPTSAVNVLGPQGFLTPVIVNGATGAFPESPSSASAGSFDLHCPNCGSSDIRMISSSSSSSSSPNVFGGPPMAVFQPRNLNMAHGRGQRAAPPPAGMGAGQPGQQNALPAGPPNMMEFQPGGAIINHFHAGGAAIALNLQTPGTYVVGLIADIAVDDRGSRGRAHHHHHRHHPGGAGHGGVDQDQGAVPGVDVTGHHHR